MHHGRYHNSDSVVSAYHCRDDPDDYVGHERCGSAQPRGAEAFVRSLKTDTFDEMQQI